MIKRMLHELQDKGVFNLCAKPAWQDVCEKHLPILQKQLEVESFLISKCSRVLSGNTKPWPSWRTHMTRSSKKEISLGHYDNNFNPSDFKMNTFFWEQLLASKDVVGAPVRFEAMTIRNCHELQS